jgi:aryl-alcohol dehydrogenase-like predicted oxidoreductase
MRYTLLGDSGLRVSEVSLGTMTFGTDWGWGADQDECRKQFESFTAAGGNFIDTADSYTNGTAETIVGQLLAGQRDRYVLATKYSLNTRAGDPNGGGNHRKHLVHALEASLRRLGTDYVDVLWLHAWDFLTPAEEVVRALDDQVRAGKVLYVGVSDTPAWLVAQMHTIAKLRGWSPFVGLQIPYSLVQREVERELLPMARALGLGVTAWASLGSGLLTGKYGRRQEEGKPDGGQRGGSDGGDQPGRESSRPLHFFEPAKLAIADEVVAVAEELGRPASQVALAWVRSRGGVIPIVGARRAAQLDDNLGFVDLELTTEQLERLDAVSAISMGFPHDFLAEHDYIHGGLHHRIDLPPNHREYATVRSS